MVVNNSFRIIINLYSYINSNVWLIGLPHAKTYEIMI
jgi:hypothetical protein